MSFHNISSRGLVASLLLAAPLLLAGAQPATAQVTVFKSPPTADEFRRALNAKTSAAPRERATNLPYLGRARGLVWKGEGRIPANSSANDSKTDASLASESAAAPVEVTETARTDAAGPAAGLPISFAPGSSRIAKRSRAYVDTVVQVMRDDPTINLVIEGHTDASGSYPRNMVLSWERAMGVYKVLVQRYGIEPKRLMPVGKGPNELLPNVAPASGENRRVQFRLGG